ncbi:MAG: helix-turn-helix domain-containing protein [Rikenellaceae bacterium]
MSKLKIRDKYEPNCPVRNVLTRIGDKWSLLVLYTLQEGGTIRFKELQREIPDISQKMLTVTLRTLEEDGFVSREVYPVVPPKVEYSLTQRANSLLPHVNNLIGWALENMESIITDRQKNVK